MLGVASASEIARAATSGDTDARREESAERRHDLVVLHPQAHADPHALERRDHLARLGLDVVERVDVGGEHRVVGVRVGLHRPLWVSEHVLTL